MGGRTQVMLQRLLRHEKHRGLRVVRERPVTRAPTLAGGSSVTKRPIAPPEWPDEPLFRRGSPGIAAQYGVAADGVIRYLLPTATDLGAMSWRIDVCAWPPLEDA